MSSKLYNFVFLFFIFNLAFSNDLANPFLVNYSISVTASSNTNYTLSGNDFNGSVSGDDPNLTFIVGDQITFNVNASGHPFYLKTVAGSGSGNQISGVTNQGTTNGAVVWTPAAAGTYYYQCGPHTAMVGTITIIKSTSVSTFNNAGGDNLWSNAANWSDGIPNVDTAKVTVNSDLIVDSSVTVAQIK
ncbi:MAG: cupredoxin domain-containing protein, partial [Flavobacteriales bacterium]